MPASDLSESLVLAEWAEKECQHLDLIASWETLLNVYDALGFKDDIADEDRLNEFKSIIGEVNKFLTRMRNGVASARSIDDAIIFLGKHVNTRDMGSVNTRSTVAYNKLKQRWIGHSINALETKLAEAIEGEEDDD